MVKNCFSLRIWFRRRVESLHYMIRNILDLCRIGSKLCINQVHFVLLGVNQRKKRVGPETIYSFRLDKNIKNFYPRLVR